MNFFWIFWCNPRTINVKIFLEGIEEESDITFSQFVGYLSQEAMLDSNKINIETQNKSDGIIDFSGISWTKKEFDELFELGDLVYVKKRNKNWFFCFGYIFNER